MLGLGVAVAVVATELASDDVLPSRASRSDAAVAAAADDDDDVAADAVLTVTTHGDGGTVEAFVRELPLLRRALTASRRRSSMSFSSPSRSPRLGDERLCHQHAPLKNV